MYVWKNISLNLKVNSLNTAIFDRTIPVHNQSSFWPKSLNFETDL